MRPPSVTVEQYAGIRAALAEGHPLEAVLAQEGVPAWRWPDVDLELSDAITKDEEVFATYSQKLAEAEDHLDRAVEPLADDLEAWAGFLAAMGKSPDLIERLGLEPPDLARLQRKWKVRFEGDPELGKRAERLARNPPPAPTSVTIARPVLAPFPWSPAPENAAANAIEPLAFLAETARKAVPRAEPVLPFAGSRPAPKASLAIEPNPMLGQTAALGRRKREAATPFEPLPPSEPEPAIAPTPPPCLPATREPPAPPVVLAPAPSGPVGHRLEPKAAMARTAAARPPTSPALPFSGEAAPPVPSSLEPVAALGATAPVRRVEAAATPFDAAPGRRPSSPRGPAVSEPVVDTRPRVSLEPLAALVATAAGARAPRQPVMPFAKKDDGAPASAAAPRASLEPVAALGSTAAASPRSVAAPLPFSAPSSASPPPDSAPLPFSAPSPDRWSPEDYGRFCAELDAGGDREAVMQRWGVGGERHRAALESWWRDRFTAEPGLRDRFVAALRRAVEARHAR